MATAVFFCRPCALRLAGTLALPAGNRLGHLKEFDGGDFDFVGELGGNGDGFHAAVVIVRDADNGEHTSGDEDGPAGGSFGREFAEAKKVSQDAGALFFYQHVNFQKVFEAERFLVIAGGMDAREAERRIEVVERYGKTK